MSHPTTRNTIFCESAEILDHQSYAADQYVIKLQAPLTAKHAKAGSFIHVKCDECLPMRRPMSIMRANPSAGWIDIMFKAHGSGTMLLANTHTGQELDLIGPIGKPFKQDKYKDCVLLIGGGVGIPPMIFLAEHIHKTSPSTKILVIMGSEIPFPFTLRPSQIMVDGIPEGIIATMPLIEDWGIPCRLTSKQDFPGCYDGYVTDLAEIWINNLAAPVNNKLEIFSCGPTPMLRAVSKLAQKYKICCEISMEEYMACAVGGCAGCTIPVYNREGMSMKRVCVDGPVFDAASVFPVN